MCHPSGKWSSLKQRIAEMQEYLSEQIEQIEEYDESLVRRMVEKVIIKSTTEFEFIFESGQRVMQKSVSKYGGFKPQAMVC